VYQYALTDGKENTKKRVPIPCITAAHFACGAGFLLDLGALNVLRLEDCSEAAAVDVTGLPPPKGAPIAIFTTRMLQHAAKDVLR
jgi:hypothetical protein